MTTMYSSKEISMSPDASTFLKNFWNQKPELKVIIRYDMQDTWTGTGVEHWGYDNRHKHTTTTFQQQHNISNTRFILFYICVFTKWKITTGLIDPYIILIHWMFKFSLNFRFKLLIHIAATNKPLWTFLCARHKWFTLISSSFPEYPCFRRAMVISVSVRAPLLSVSASTKKLFTRASTLLRLESELVIK